MEAGSPRQSGGLRTVEGEGDRGTGFHSYLRERPAGEPWPGGSAGWSVVPYTKRLWIQFCSGHISKLRVQSLVGALMGGN